MDPLDNRRMQVADKGADRLMSINEAVRRGYTKLRLDHWANPDDYMEFTIVVGTPGPWVKLWSPVNEIVGNKNPHLMLITMVGDLDDPCWRPLPKTLVRP
jgi:hypothetical protein